MLAVSNRQAAPYSMAGTHPMADLDPALVKLVEALARAAALEDHEREQRIVGWWRSIRGIDGGHDLRGALKLAGDIVASGAGEPFHLAAVGCKRACERALSGHTSSHHIVVARNAVRSLRMAIEEVIVVRE